MSLVRLAAFESHVFVGVTCTHVIPFFPHVNLFFITERSLPTNCKQRGKIIFPPLQPKGT